MESRELVEGGAILTEKRVLLFMNCLLLGIGITGGPLVMRLYYLHGGSRIWLQACLQTAGFPVMLPPLIIAYFRRRRAAAMDGLQGRPFLITAPLLAFSASNGLLAGAADYLYAAGVGMIPVSTSSLILSTQLAFTAVFCYLLVSQRFTAFSVNAVVMLTMASAVLALHPRSDMQGEPRSEYFKGFLMTLGASASFALVLPMVELSYRTAEGDVTYDFHAIKREAEIYELGKAAYCLVMAFSAIMWQCFYLGALGVIHFGSSLLSGIIIAVCIPITEVLAVIFYKEKFQPEKGVSLALSIWGFISYFYGEIIGVKSKRRREIGARNMA